VNKLLGRTFFVEPSRSNQEHQSSGTNHAIS
jgi:hypothetical protein